MNTQKGFVSVGILIAIILGVVVVGGGTYYVVNQNPVQEDVQDYTDLSATQQNAPAAKPTTNTATQAAPKPQPPAPTPSVTLATFSDTRVSYTFKYPNKYRADVWVHSAISNEVCIVGASVQNPQGCWMQFRTSPTSEVSAQMIIDESLSSNAAFEQEAIREGQSIPAWRRHVASATVGNVAAKSIIDTARDGKQHLVNIFVEYGGRTYVFSSGAVVGTPEHKEFLDIMNSVAFTASQ